MTHGFFPGRERAYDLVIDGQPYRCVRAEGDAPIWSVESTPAVVDKQDVPAEEERSWLSWHLGAFYSEFMQPGTYHYGLGVDCRTPRVLLLGPEVTTKSVTGGVRKFAELGTKLYALAGDSVWDIPFTALDTPTAALTWTGKPPIDAMPFAGNLVITRTADTIVLWPGSGVGTPLTGITGSLLTKFFVNRSDAQYWAIVRATVNVGGENVLTWASEGSDLAVAGNWAFAYPIGEKRYGLTGLVAREQTIFGAKPDGLYYLDGTGRSPCVLPLLSPDTDNGVGALIDSTGAVWMPTVEGYWRYDSNSGGAIDCTPGRGLPNTSPIRGAVTAQVQYRSWQIASVYNGADSFLMLGQMRGGDQPGIGPMVWHGAWVHAPLKQITALTITQLPGYPLLVYGCSDGTVGLIRLPTNGDSPLLDPSYRYTTFGRLYFPLDDFGVPGTRWRLTGIEIETVNVDANSYIEVWLRGDQESWQFVGRVTYDGRQTIEMPPGVWMFSKYTLRLDIYNASATSSPRITALIPRASRRSLMRDLVATTVFCSDRATSLYHVQTRLSGKAQLSHLKRAQRAPPIILSDWWTGEQRDREVLMLPVREALITQKGVLAADQAAQLTLMVLKTPADEEYELVRTLPSYWGNNTGTGDTWGDDFYDAEGTVYYQE